MSSNYNRHALKSIRNCVNNRLNNRCTKNLNKIDRDVTEVFDLVMLMLLCDDDDYSYNESASDISESHETKVCCWSRSFCGSVEPISTNEIWTHSVQYNTAIFRCYRKICQFWWANWDRATEQTTSDGKFEQETHHQMRIPERDDLLSVYLFTLIYRSVDIYG